jgi:chromosomal replication initiator protein
VPLDLPPGGGFGRVLRAVAAEFGCTLEDLLGEGRPAEIALARHAAMALGRRVLGYSLPKLGRLLRRDHTTVLYGIRRIDALSADDPGFAARMDGMAAAIRAAQQQEGRRQ